MPRKFDLESYDTVESRIKKFYTDHPYGAILTELLSDPNNTDVAVVKATIIVSGDVVATGHAMEVRDKELSTSSYGKEYESVNYTAWLENAETSAIGRGLANYNYSGAKRPSREEMEKVERGAKGKEVPTMPSKRADGPPQPSGGKSQAFLTIVKAANHGIFGSKASVVMTDASTAEKNGQPEHLEAIIKEWKLADA